MALGKVRVDTNKVMAAFLWLKENNQLYADMNIPNIDAIPVPIVLEDNLSLVPSQNANI